MYNNSKWDAPLPWELKRNMTVVSFAESAAAGAASQALGPITLRKSSVAVSTSVMSEIAKLLPNNKGGGLGGLYGQFDSATGTGNGNGTNSTAMSRFEASIASSSSAFAPDRPVGLAASTALPSEHDRLLMTPEDIQEAEARAESARQQAEMDAIAANPALQIKNLINSKVSIVSQGFSDSSTSASTNVQKGLDAMKGSAASIVSGMKQGLQKGIGGRVVENPFEHMTHHGKSSQPLNSKMAASTTASGPATTGASASVSAAPTKRDTDQVTNDSYNNKNQ
jgi:hypothetical protein